MSSTPTIPESSAENHAAAAERAREAHRAHDSRRRHPRGRHDGSRPVDPAKVGFGALTLGALGVVFGDIGTSPLYSLQTVFTADNHAVHATAAGVYGVISLVFWAITVIVSVKYVSFIMRADNGGEGGIMALTALIQTATPKRAQTKALLVVFGIIGASLFYGDGMITPAISVLSAVEGLKVVSPSLEHVVLPITLAVLLMLFAIQRFGTGVVGRLFGPVMALWFGVLALLGGREVVKHPGILKALSPSYGASFFIHHAAIAFIAMAAVVLAITGAEALYADMGHFGRNPIRRAWFFIVFPALTLNYLGQGALILRSPKTVENPFFLMTPQWAQIPMVLLATVATVIASQSVISGAFSVTRQAVQLGFLPRLAIHHTSREEVGQVYAPAINWGLAVAVAALVLSFGSSAKLASAYGVAVTGTFVLNTVLFLSVARILWNQSLWKVIGAAVLFLGVELVFFAANLTKIVHGGWLPLVIALAAFTVLTTWQKGRGIVTRRRSDEEGDLRGFLAELHEMKPPVFRSPGTAVFLNASIETTPLAMRANLEHNHSLHEHVLIVSVQTMNVPHVAEDERLTVDGLGGRDDQISRICIHFGFQDEPNVPRALRLAEAQELIDGIDLEHASYFLSKITIVNVKTPGMMQWRKKLFLAMAHNVSNPAEYFGLPGERVVAMGAQIEL